MPNTIYVPDIDVEFEFPDDMTDQAIEARLNADIPNFKKGAPRDVAARVGKGIATGVAQAIKGIPRLLDHLAPMGAESSEELAALKEAQAASQTKQGDSTIASDPLYQKGDEWKRNAEEFYKPNPLRDDKTASIIAEGVASTVPQLAVGWIPAIGIPLAAAQYGLSQGEDAYEEAVSAGHPEAADKAFLMNAGVGAATEGVIGASPRMLQIVRKARLRGVAPDEFGKTVVGRAQEWLAKNPGKAVVMESMAREVPQETLEQVAQNWIANDLAGYDPERSLTQGVKESAIGAAGTSLILGGIGGASVRAQRRMEAPTRAQAELSQSVESAYEDMPLSVEEVNRIEAELVGKAAVAQSTPATPAASPEAVQTPAPAPVESPAAVDAAIAQPQNPQPKEVSNGQEPNQEGMPQVAAVEQTPPAAAPTAPAPEVSELQQKVDRLDAAIAQEAAAKSVLDKGAFKSSQKRVEAETAHRNASEARHAAAADLPGFEEFRTKYTDAYARWMPLKKSDPKYAEQQAKVAEVAAQNQDWANIVAGQPGFLDAMRAKAKVLAKEDAAQRRKAKRDELNKNRPPDIIDWIQDNKFTLRGKAGMRPGEEAFYEGEYEEAKRRVGKLFAKKGTSLDRVVQAAVMDGQMAEQDVGKFLTMVSQAAKARVNYYKEGDTEGNPYRAETKQYEDWKAASTTPAKTREQISVHDLNLGDSFELQGHTVRVKSVEFDPDTMEPTHVVLQDGDKYGTQQVENDDLIHIDKGTLKRAEPEFVSPDDEMAAEEAAKQVAQSPAPAARLPVGNPLKTPQKEMGFADDSFRLTGETTTDGERQQREKDAAAQAKAEQDARQGDMFSSLGGTGSAPAVHASAADVQAAVSEVTAKLKSAVPVRVVSEPGRAHNGRLVEGWFDPKAGEVVLNAGNLRDLQHAKEVLAEELLVHYGLEQVLGEEFADAVTEIGVELDPAKLRESADLYGLDLNDPAQWREAVVEHVGAVAQEEAGKGWWRRLVDAIRDGLSRVFGLRQTPEAKIREWLKRSREAVKQSRTVSGVVKLSLGAPVPGKRKFTQAGSWIGHPDPNNPQQYVAHTNASRMAAAKAYVDQFASPEEAFRGMVSDFEIGNIDNQMTMLIATEVANRAGAAAIAAKNDVDALQQRRLGARAIEWVRIPRSDAGQTLQASHVSNQMLGAGAFVAEWQHELEEQQKRKLGNLYNEIASVRIRGWLHEAGQKAVTQMAQTMSKAQNVVDRIMRKAGREYKVSWHDIMTSAAEAQGHHQEAIYRLIRSHPILGKLTRDDAMELTKLLHAGWRRQQERIFRAEFSKVIPLPVVTVAEAAQVKAATPDLIKWANLGLLDNEAFRNAIAPRFGLKPITAESAKRVYAAAQKAQESPQGVARQTAYRKLFQQVAVESGIPNTELVRSYWYAAVLSGAGTQGRNILGNAAMLLDQSTALMVREPKAAPRIIAGMLRGMRNAAMGDVGAIMQGQESPAIVGVSIREGGSALEAAAQDQRQWVRFLSNGKYVSRFMVAMDSFFFAANAEMKATFDAYRKGQEDGIRTKAEMDKYIAGLLHVSDREIAAAQRQAEVEAAVGLLPMTGKAAIRSRRDEILRQLRPDEIQDNALRFGLQSTLNNDPDGVIGYVSDFFIQMRGRYPWTTPLIPFVRISANVANMLLNHSPVGLARLYATRPGAPVGHLHKVFAAQPVSLDEWQHLRAQVVLGHVTMMALAAMVLQYIDDDDPAMQITGSMGGVTPEKRRQLEMQGIKPYQVRVGRVGIDYRQEPSALFLAAIGNYCDGKRYAKMDQKSLEVQLATALAAGHAVLVDQQFLSGLMQWFDRPVYGSEKHNLIEKLIRTKAQMVGGFVPSLLKEADTWRDPKDPTATRWWEHFQRQVPVARSFIGKPVINVLGEPIARPKTPVNWLVKTPSDDPVWRALAAKAQDGVFVPDVSASTSIKENGQRRKLTDDEMYRYKQLSGQEMRKRLENNLERFDQMTPEQAERWLKRQSENVHKVARNRLKFAQVQE